MADRVYEYEEILEDCILPGCDNGMVMEEGELRHCGQCNGVGKKWRLICTNPPSLYEIRESLKDVVWADPEPDEDHPAAALTTLREAVRDHLEIQHAADLLAFSSSKAARIAREKLHDSRERLRSLTSDAPLTTGPETTNG